jgi:hypothetical protein
MECNDTNRDTIFRDNNYISHPGYHPSQHPLTNKLSAGFDLIHNVNQHHPDPSLNGSFTNSSIYPYPALIVSGDKLKQQNADIHQKVMDHEVLTINNDPSCKEVFNVRNLNDSGLLQEGYARNIDLDSELKRINHLTDKCYYDNYKYHPHEAPKGNGLYCHRETLVNDYTHVGQPKCQPRGDYQSAIRPGHLQLNEETRTRFSDNEVQHGCHTRPDYPNEKYDKQCQMVMEKPQSCLSSFGSFNQVDTLSSLPDSAKTLLKYKHKNTNHMPKHYKFNGDMVDNNKKYHQDFPAQRIFNNFTKRSTLPNFHNTFDINPNLLR